MITKVPGKVFGISSPTERVNFLVGVLSVPLRMRKNSIGKKQKSKEGPITIDQDLTLEMRRDKKHTKMIRKGRVLVAVDSLYTEDGSTFQAITHILLGRRVPALEEFSLTRRGRKDLKVRK